MSSIILSLHHHVSLHLRVTLFLYDCAFIIINRMAIISQKQKQPMERTTTETAAVNLQKKKPNGKTKITFTCNTKSTLETAKRQRDEMICGEEMRKVEASFLGERSRTPELQNLLECVFSARCIPTAVARKNDTFLSLAYFSGLNTLNSVCTQFIYSTNYDSTQK